MDLLLGLPELSGCGVNCRLNSYFLDMWLVGLRRLLIVAAVLKQGAIGKIYHISHTYTQSIF